ncbi:DUF1425 domain-containing protein [Ferrimonas aestuarii]|uniref:DUF1425 domain-containing protein n=1 Tax=Ferrimonas aestuarii TaxID=2569539 RepID=A0A4U1BS04_9GAMM|nr:YcfL family protein [Ferrimonas aestuarii]TKB57356.1 DUF1425 domain-containing protein [Ferrimonas aestuarii]
MKRVMVVALVAALVGCSTTTSGLVVHSSSAEDVQINNGALGRDLSLVSVNKGRLNGRLQGRVNLESNSSSDLYLQYRFSFFDGEGVLQESAHDGWHSLNLAGGERRQVSSLSLNSKAEDFRFEIRRIISD